MNEEKTIKRLKKR